MIPRSAMPRARTVLAIALLIASLPLFWLGITRPIISITPEIPPLVREVLGLSPERFSDADIVSLLRTVGGFVSGGQFDYDALSQPRAESIVSGVEALIETDNIAPAIVIIAFTLVMPIAKMVILALVPFAARRYGRLAVTVVAAIHKWAMVDVFAVAILVFALSDVTYLIADAREGLLWFLGYFVASQIGLAILPQPAPVDAGKAAGA